MTTTWNQTSEETYAFGAHLVAITTFEHLHTKVNVVLAHISNTTLCNVSIVVPTLAFDNKGLAHTLEHLVFCGSERHPQKGLLDKLASACYSNGTNAYTAEDHTCYTFTGCAASGMLSVLPVFLDHVFFPLLAPECFCAEVCYVDAEKIGGVVFCEMKARENTEEDLSFTALKRRLLGVSSFYAAECGGLTHDIVNITLDDIRRFHRAFYVPHQTTLLVAGDFDAATTLQTLDVFFTERFASGAPIASSSIDASSLEGTQGLGDAAADEQDSRVEHVEFPAVDEAVGSLVFGWDGPDVFNVEELNAIDLLLKFCNENSSSILQETFVECMPAPLASSVDHDILSFMKCAVSISFSGVPHRESADAEHATTEESSVDEDADFSGEDCDEEEDEALGACSVLDSSVISQKLTAIFENFEAHFSLEKFRSFLRRVINKTISSFENSSLDLVTQHITPQIVLHSYAKFTDRMPEKPFTVGSSLRIIKDIEEIFLQRDAPYFLEIVKKYFVGCPMVEIKAVPNAALNVELQQKYEVLHRQTLAKYNDAQLAEMLRFVEQSKAAPADSIDDNIRNDDNISVTPIDVFAFKSVALDCSRSFVPGFGMFNAVSSPNSYTQFILAFPLDILEESHEDRSMLLLFQELLLQSDVLVPPQLEGVSAGFNTFAKVIPFAEVVSALTEVSLSYSASVGLDSDVFSCGYFSGYFVLYANAPTHTVKRLMCMLLEALFFVQFSVERISAVAHNLLNDLIEAKRDPDSVIDFLLTRATFPQDTAAILHGEQPTKKQCGVQKSPFANDVYLGMFVQEHLLARVIENPLFFLQKLESLKQKLLASVVESGRNFLQIAHPRSCSEPKLSDVIDHFQNTLANLRQNTASLAHASVQSCKNSNDHFAYKLPSIEGMLQNCAKKHIFVEMNNLSSSHLIQVVPLATSFDDIKADPLEYYSLLVICQMLSATEGLLYSTIRGEGLAYRVHMTVNLFARYILFNVGESVDPLTALNVFHANLRTIFADPLSFFTEATIAAAISSIIFQFQESRNSSYELFVSAFKNFISFDAFPPKQHLEQLSRIRQMPAIALASCFEKYLKPFLLRDASLLVVLSHDKKTLTQPPALFAPIRENVADLDAVISSDHLPKDGVQLDDISSFYLNFFS